MTVRKTKKLSRKSANGNKQSLEDSAYFPSPKDSQASGNPESEESEGGPESADEDQDQDSSGAPFIPDRFTLDGRSGNPIANTEMSQLWRVHDELLDRIDVLKLIKVHQETDPERIKEIIKIFKNEVRLTHELMDNPVFVKCLYNDIIDNDDKSKHLFLVLDLIDGLSLDRRLNIRGKSWELGNQFKNWMLDLMDGIEYAHSKDIVHHDLKPENIVIEAKTDKLRIIDLGIACDLNDAPIRELWDYCSKNNAPPERVTWGSAYRPDPLDDIFGIGGIMLYCRYQVCPFPGKTEEEIDKRIADYDVFFPDKPKKDALDMVIMKALKPREERYKNVAELRNGFMAALDKMGVLEPQGSKKHSLVSSRMAAALILLVLLILANGFWFLFPEQVEDLKLLILDDTQIIETTIEEQAAAETIENQVEKQRQLPYESEGNSQETECSLPDPRDCNDWSSLSP